MFAKSKCQCWGGSSSRTPGELVQVLVDRILTWAGSLPSSAAELDVQPVRSPNLLWRLVPPRDDGQTGSSGPSDPPVPQPESLSKIPGRRPVLTLAFSLPQDPVPSGFSAGEVLIPLADEYDPMFPNDYEKVVKRQREERQRQRELERQKEIEEREK